MGFLLTCFVLITAASALQENDLLQGKISVGVRVAVAQSYKHETSNPALTTSSRQAKRLNFDSCTTEQDCAGSRLCHGDSSDELCSTGSRCICVPTTPPMCNMSSDCDEGETCVINTELSDRALCVSDMVFPMLPGFTIVDEDGTSPGPQLPTPGEDMPTPDEEIPTPDVEIPTPDVEIPSPEVEIPIPTPGMPVGEGKNFDRCSREQDCASDRKCAQLATDDTFEPCMLGSRSCICIPNNLGTLLCSTSDDCDVGESCAKVKNIGSQVSVCISDAIINSSDGFIVVDDNENMKEISRKGKM